MGAVTCPRPQRGSRVEVGLGLLVAVALYRLRETGCAPSLACPCAVRCAMSCSGADCSGCGSCTCSERSSPDQSVRRGLGEGTGGGAPLSRSRVNFLLLPHPSSSDQRHRYIVS